MRNITIPNHPIYFHSTAAVGGFEEGRGPLGSLFDFIDPTDKFGMDTWERAEGEMSRICLNLALSKVGLSPSDLSVLVAGDLQNQCVASSGGLFSFGIPYLGLYGACSTCCESLMVASLYLLSTEGSSYAAAVTSSHNCAAERQFRTPLEYGGQRPPTSQWTATASGAFILSKKPADVKITAFMPGKIIDGYTKDSSNMGAAMALSAFDTLSTFFEDMDADSFDLVLTGDLGRVGSDILRELLSEGKASLRKLAALHEDCGLLIYDRKKQDVHSGGSGCGCSASVLSSRIIPLISKGEFRRVAFLSTGALMSPSSVLQGDHIAGISPIVVLEREDS